ncbi:stress-inducible protein [Streptomyces lunaelactis]|uniref:Stress-inducible protein n=1 Tax=Streptomyces lunaelactis TaxID=1535768 RepID=A0A2R4TC83_9ACTN|nr:universal stress protein [Streptomyces lunaelactis]AVZ76723.1 stress-inducible protein [Streptomyces lunaelactis]
MTRPVITAVDGSAESRAAAEWAAREARMRALPLHILNVSQPTARPRPAAPQRGAVTAPGGATLTKQRERLPNEWTDRLRERHADLVISVEQVSGRPMQVLLSAARTAAVLVLGSPAPSPSETPDTLDTPTGFFSASVTTGVVAHAERPVVLVRTGEKAEDEWLPVPGSGPRLYEEYCDVVLGLDLSRPCDTLIEYAFAAAASRGAALRIVHGWSQPPVFGAGAAAVDPSHSIPPHSASRLLDDVLRSWRRDFPGIEVKQQCVVGHAQDHLVDASKDASLLVVGRRIRRSAIGIHIGPVTRAVLQGATSPVAVVPHN